MNRSLLLIASFLMLDSFVHAKDAWPLSDPNNSGDWVLNESVSDEFNGTSLDGNKWNNLGENGNFYGEWKGRAPSQYNPANVRVEDGNLIITSKWEPGFAFSPTTCSNGMKYGQLAPVTTAAIITKAKFKFGYLEMRCKAADGPVSSSFWTTGYGGEIDVFEHFGSNPTNKFAATRYHTSFHDWRKGSPTFGKRIWTNDHQLGFRGADDFHVYGLHWDEAFVAIYVDGRLVNCVTKEAMGDKWVASNEQKVWIDSETFDWEVRPAQLTAKDFGEGRDFIIDYCRIWQSDKRTEPIAARANLIANAGFETGERVWKGSAAISDDKRSGERAAGLKDAGIIEQFVTLKPNTTYVLSAWARSPETNQADKWFNAFLGVKDHGNAEITTMFFFPDYHQKSLEFTTGPDSTSAVIFFTNRPHAKLALIDDVELVEAPRAVSVD